MITAANQWGALHALESFSQLVTWVPGGSPEYSITNASIQITDAPRFRWRGMLIDTSRHYLALETVLVCDSHFIVLAWL